MPGEDRWRFRLHGYPRRVISATAVCLLALVPLAACGSPGSDPGSGGRPSGEVDVLSAGSLLGFMQNTVGPGFHAATGYTLANFSAGSADLAADIKGKVKRGDVFISASPAVDASLTGAANGNWVSWYASFATSKLVIGYDPNSRFAAGLRSKPWYRVVTEPGFRLGLTPPATDPKGALAVQALDRTARRRQLPALRAIGSDPANQFPETDLEAQVDSGQLDAGFFYLAEARAAGIPTVPLTGVNLHGDYTITIPNRAPHTASAVAFVRYLLGPRGRARMGRYGFVPVSPPAVTGTGVPPALSGLLPGA